MSVTSNAGHYHIVTQQSQAAEITLPIPSFCKPLTASVRTLGEGETGILASFFDPEQHAWVVRQVPVHESWPHHPPPCLIVRVVTLVDPENLYELRVSLSTALDGIDNDELYALQRRSLLYGLLVEEHLADKSGATLRAAGSEGQLPQLREAVTLAAPVDVMDGFVLTGGGFISDFPVLRDGPALPRAMDTVYDDILDGDDFCGPPMPIVGAHLAGTGSATTASVGANRGLPVDSNKMREYTAWSVTAAANAGLACISIGLRRRSPREWSQLQSQSKPNHFAPPRSSTGPEASVATNPGLTWGRRPPNAVSGCEAVTVARDHTTLGSGMLPNNDVDGEGDAYGLVRTHFSAAEDTAAVRPLLETLTLRGEVDVRLCRCEGEEWSISLPPPHGSLALPMGPDRALMTVARRSFYCE
ncbi:hypothetical protein GH5_03155 [Leishmania sp. Ghana 2012 LV757]|uniref:hypothetical protein n=1 Tax=Leishmania sp. Ghana 2012 LV757 TaxID=2803181 RepID=UPI001B6F4047|nr:hypothetical protein GH5_03155 [Leishmania sp. Ghana 2012 LV757]